MRRRYIKLKGITATVIAIACQAYSRTPTAQISLDSVQAAAGAIPEHAEQPDHDHTSEVDHDFGGEEIYANASCAGCHWDSGQGPDIAPALAGHSVAQVKRQIRASIGIMPVFPPDKISNKELAEFIAGMDGGLARAGMPGDDLLMHHWMALSAIETNDDNEASHHVAHILEGAEGQHLRLME
jgi:mono/diheme cytochrome c family protein